MNEENKNKWGDIPNPGDSPNTGNARPTPIQLPEIASADQILKEPMQLPPELVEGLIHEGTTSMLAGGSKTCKTFIMLDLAISVSQGVQWWGRDVEPGPVLFVNFELGPPFLQRRLFDLVEDKKVGVLDAAGAVVSLPDFDIWNLRGYATDVTRLMPGIIERCRGRDYAMIILDPIYKLMGGRNENDAGKVAEVLNEFDNLAQQTGAAVLYSHHYAKGSAAKKEQIDRASGSGVFARHPDSIITLTPHEEENAFTVEGSLRNFPAPKPFVVRWGYPLMQMAPGLDPAKLRRKAGAASQYTVAATAACLVDGFTTGQWKDAAMASEGYAASTFAKLKKRAVAEGRVEQKGNAWFHIHQIHSVNVETGESRRRVAAPQERVGGDGKAA